MRYEIDIRMSGHGLFIKGEKIPFEIQGKNKSIPLNIRTVKLHQNVIIPAYTCVSIPLQIKSHHFDKNDLVLFEPMGGMPFIRESVVPHLSATLSERCTGGRRALSARSVCFTEKGAEEYDIKDCTGKEFLKKYTSHPEAVNKVSLEKGSCWNWEHVPI